MNDLSSGVLLDPPYRQAVDDALKQFKFGDVIPREWLEIAFGTVPRDHCTHEEHMRRSWEHLDAMDGFRKTLLEQKYMALQNVRGVGYRIVQPHQQTAFAMSEMKNEVGAAVRKCNANLTYVRTDLLSDQQRNENAEARGKLAAVAAFSRQRLKG